jgi:Type II CAAX prenyl endopeptidase Rce1-like
VADAPTTVAHWWSPAPAPETPPVTTARAYTEVLGVWALFFAVGLVVAAETLTSSPPTGYVTTWADSVPNIVANITTGVLSVLVPVLLAERRGLSRRALGLRAPSPPGVASGLRMAAWAVLALIVGGIVTSSLTSRNPVLNVPFSYANLALELAHFVQAGFIEEVVVLAFVVATLEQARRPRAEIVVVAVLLRMSYHIYYGPGVVGIAVWALVFVWLYLRFRTIVPLIVVHSCWDVLVGLSHQWRDAGAAFVLLVIALLLTAPITWLVERGAPQPPLVAP